LRKINKKKRKNEIKNSLDSNRGSALIPRGILEKYQENGKNKGVIKICT